jgi:hypothetical protein
MTTTLHRAILLCSVSCALAVGCSGSDDFDPGKLRFDEARPELAEPGRSPGSYSGDNAIVLEAQSKLFDGFALHSEVIYPTCGPINGVCHHAKEYPALHTPANFLGAIDAPCNVQPGSYVSVFDRCERPGDRLDFGDAIPEIEIAYIEYIPGERDDYDSAPQADSPGLHIYLAGEVRGDRTEFYGGAEFVRTFVNAEGDVQDLPFFSYDSHYWVVDPGGYVYGEEQGAHLMADVRDYQTQRIEALLEVGLVQGDFNRNGVLGARLEQSHIALIKPGYPEESYLVGRMFGTMGSDLIPGSRMPLANEPLSNAEMLALFCFIEKLPQDGSPVDLHTPIDYEGCSYSAQPEVLERLGAGVTWVGRVSRILAFNCGGCHGGSAPQAGLNLKDGDVYSRLMQPSAQNPDLKLVESAQPDLSYLWLKVNGDPSIVGAPMPLDPLNGTRRLTTQELADLKSWIEEGALMNGGDTMPDAGMSMDAGLDAGPDAGQDAGPDDSDAGN